ncbi:MAG: hypothetical protein OXM01_13225 [Gemmatimonadota bacterium]|nr:hypothetical protein [Gemmatimonadota bacterium]
MSNNDDLPVGCGCVVLVVFVTAVLWAIATDDSWERMFAIVVAVMVLFFGGGKR